MTMPIRSRTARCSLGLLAAFVLLRATRAEANLSLTLVVNNCANPNWGFGQTNSAGRSGRLTVTDQTGAVAYAQPSVPFTSGNCEVTFTMNFSAALLSRFINADDPLFLELDACKV